MLSRLVPVFAVFVLLLIAHAFAETTPEDKAVIASKWLFGGSDDYPQEVNSFRMQAVIDMHGTSSYEDTRFALGAMIIRNAMNKNGGICWGGSSKGACNGAGQRWIPITYVIWSTTTVAQISEADRDSLMIAMMSALCHNVPSMLAHRFFGGIGSSRFIPLIRGILKGTNNNARGCNVIASGTATSNVLIGANFYPDQPAPKFSFNNCIRTETLLPGQIEVYAGSGAKTVMFIYKFGDVFSTAVSGAFANFLVSKNYQLVGKKCLSQSNNVRSDLTTKNLCTTNDDCPAGDPCSLVTYKGTTVLLAYALTIIDFIRFSNVAKPEILTMNGLSSDVAAFMEAAAFVKVTAKMTATSMAIHFNDELSQTKTSAWWNYQSTTDCEYPVSGPAGNFYVEPEAVLCGATTGQKYAVNLIPAGIYVSGVNPSVKQVDVTMTFFAINDMGVFAEEVMRYTDPTYPGGKTRDFDSFHTDQSFDDRVAIRVKFGKCGTLSADFQSMTAGSLTPCQTSADCPNNEKCQPWAGYGAPVLFDATQRNGVATCTSYQIQPCAGQPIGGDTCGALVGPSTTAFGCNLGKKLGEFNCSPANFDATCTCNKFRYPSPYDWLDSDAPVFTALQPANVTDPFSIDLTVVMNEDGSVWCKPYVSSGEADASQAAANAARTRDVSSFKAGASSVVVTGGVAAAIKLQNLQQNTLYYVVCYGEDSEFVKGPNKMALQSVTDTVQRITTPKLIVWENFELDSYLNVVAMILSIFLSIFGLLIIALVVKHRKSSMIQAASWKFCCITVLGGLVAGWSSLPLSNDPSNDTDCQLRNWLPSISLAIMFGPLFAKTFRISVLFNMKRFRTIKFSDIHVFAAFMVILLIQIIINIVATIVDDSAYRIVRNTSISAGKYYFVQECQLNTTFVYGTFIFQGFVLLWGVYLCWRVKAVPSRFNESFHISICLVFAFVFCAIMIPVQFMISDDPNATALIRSLGLLIGVLVVFGALFLPKLITIKLGQQNATNVTFSSTHRSTTSTVNSSSSSNAETKRLTDRIDELEKALAAATASGARGTDDAMAAI